MMRAKPRKCSDVAAFSLITQAVTSNTLRQHYLIRNILRSSVTVVKSDAAAPDRFSTAL